jgi:hypothetical protein
MYRHDSARSILDLICLVRLRIARLLLSVAATALTAVRWARAQPCLAPLGAAVVDVEDGRGRMALGLKTDRKIPVPTCSVFHFCPFVSVFAGSRFRIYRNERGVFPSVSAEFCFHPKMICIYSVFHPVLNLHEMCRN